MCVYIYIYISSIYIYRYACVISYIVYRVHCLWPFPKDSSLVCSSRPWCFESRMHTSAENNVDCTMVSHRFRCIWMWDLYSKAIAFLRKCVPPDTAVQKMEPLKLA